jgi:hypothetical protein
VVVSTTLVYREYVRAGEILSRFRRILSVPRWIQLSHVVVLAIFVYLKSICAREILLRLALSSDRLSRFFYVDLLRYCTCVAETRQISRCPVRYPWCDLFAFPGTSGTCVHVYLHASSGYSGDRVWWVSRLVYVVDRCDALLFSRGRQVL